MKKYAATTTVPYWIGATLSGLAAVGYALLFKYAGGFSIQYASTKPTVLLIISPLCFVVGWWLVKYFAPEAAGSGIPQLLAASELSEKKDLNQIERLLGPRTGIVKVFSSLLCALGGGAIGREGPTLQVSAVIFYYIGKRFKKLLPNVSHQSWIVVGGAAGIASAFNTPLGGIVYAMEELATMHFSHFRTMLIFSVIISGLVAQWISGSYLYLGFPRIEPVAFSFLPFAILLGVISGGTGAIFGLGLNYFSSKRDKVKSQWKLAGIAVSAGLFMAMLAYFVGPRSVGPGAEAIADLLFRNGEVASFTMIFARISGTLISYLSGCAGGIFSPSLAIGAEIGSKIASLTGAPDANLMVLLGMIGFLTGVVRAPFTSFVLVLEMTDRHSAIFPMMLVALAAFATARLIDTESFYERRKHVYLR